jgi:hypothetical protein
MKCLRTAPGNSALPDRLNPELVTMRSSPIILYVGTLLWLYSACRCCSSSYLNGVVTLARDNCQFWPVGARMKSWNAADAVSMASGIVRGVDDTMSCNEERVRRRGNSEGRQTKFQNRKFQNTQCSSL